MILNRRSALLGLTAAISLGPASLAVAPAGTDRRLVVILLRGALDGLAAVQPYGDPALVRWRSALLLPEPGQTEGLLDLGGRFGLHPALGGLHGLYRNGEALILHATAGPWRSRSHFEAQDDLESGATRRLTSGWLNRAILALPPPPARSGVAGREVGQAVAVGTAMPLLLEGPARVASWAPSRFGAPAPDLYARLAALNHADPVLGPAIAEGLRSRGFAERVMDEDGVSSLRERNTFPALAAAAAELLAAPDGPRIAALEIGGWDTHADQNARLVQPLRQFDAGIVALKAGLGPAWAGTVVLALTEFGRTVRANGTKGTDHGTGTVAFAAGGAIVGGRVLGDWPGLSQSALFEDRDLQPTTDLRALVKGVLAAHLGLSDPALAQVFTDSAGVGAMRGLVRPV